MVILCPLPVFFLFLFPEFRYIDKETAGLVGKGDGSAGAGLPSPTDVGSGRAPRGPLKVPEALRAAAEAAGLKLGLPAGRSSIDALDALGEHLTASNVDADFKAEVAATTAAFNAEAEEDAPDNGAAAASTLASSGEILEVVVGVGDTAFFPPAGAKPTIEDNFFAGNPEEEEEEEEEEEAAAAKKDGKGEQGEQGEQGDDNGPKEMATTAPPSPSTMLEPGQTVTILGLARKPALNGQLATVLSKDAWPTDSGRIGIELRDGKTLSIRPINLRRMLPSKSSPGGMGAVAGGMLTEVMPGPNGGAMGGKKKKKGTPSRNMTGLIGTSTCTVLHVDCLTYTRYRARIKQFWKVPPLASKLVVSGHL